MKTRWFPPLAVLAAARFVPGTVAAGQVRDVKAGKTLVFDVVSDEKGAPISVEEGLLVAVECRQPQGQPAVVEDVGRPGDRRSHGGVRGQLQGTALGQQLGEQQVDRRHLHHGQVRNSGLPIAASQGQERVFEVWGANLQSQDVPLPAFALNEVKSLDIPVAVPAVSAPSLAGTHNLGIELLSVNVQGQPAFEKPKDSFEFSVNFPAGYCRAKAPTRRAPRSGTEGPDPVPSCLLLDPPDRRG